MHRIQNTKVVWNKNLDSLGAASVYRQDDQSKTTLRSSGVAQSCTLAWDQGIILKRGTILPRYIVLNSFVYLNNVIRLTFRLYSFEYFYWTLKDVSHS